MHLLKRLGRYWAVWTVLAVVGLFRLGSAGLYGNPLLACNIYDDGFYYFKIAQNIVAGHGMTFDGTSYTNGFQPLWMIALLPAAILASPTSVTVNLIVFNTWNFLFFGVAAFMLWHMVRRWYGPWPANIAVLLLGYSRITTLFLGGVEAGLLAITLIGLLWACDRLIRNTVDRPVDWWIAGFVGAFVVLTRLDHALLAAPLLALVVVDRTWRTGNWSRFLSRLARSAVPGILLVSLYLLFNLTYFDHPFPISGAVKIAAHRAAGVGSGLMLQDKGVVLLVLISPMIALGLLGISVARRERLNSMNRLLFYWSIGNTLYMAFLIFNVQEIAKWYLVSPALLGCIVASWMTQTVILRLPRVQLLWGTLTAVLILLCCVTHFKRVRQHSAPDGAYNAHFKFADWCNRNLPEGAIIGMADAGLISVLSSRPVMNIDGLVNDWAYKEACERGEAFAELRRRGVNYLVNAYGKNMSYDDQGRFNYTITMSAGSLFPNSVTAEPSDVVYDREYVSDSHPSGSQRLIMWSFR